MKSKYSRRGSHRITFISGEWINLAFPGPSYQTILIRALEVAPYFNQRLATTRILRCEPYRRCLAWLLVECWYYHGRYFERFLAQAIAQASEKLIRSLKRGLGGGRNFWCRLDAGFRPPRWWLKLVSATRLSRLQGVLSRNPFADQINDISTSRYGKDHAPWPTCNVSKKA